MSMGKVALTVVVATVAVVVVAGAVALVIFNSRAAHVTGSDAKLPKATDQQLEIAADTRVFFGHQSVGGNVIAGMEELYAARGLGTPQIVESGKPLTGRTAVFEHAFIGSNGDPSGKIREFDAIIRGGVGNRVDVALMKLCYVDITSKTDVDAVFGEYRTTMAKLQRDHPDVTFLHVTTPITTERSMAARAKALVGRGDNFAPENNAARERYNALLRQEYGDSVFDLAAIQSTTPDGGRVEGSVDGQLYYAMYDGYASDPGHLNQEGSRIAAEALMGLIAGNAEP